MTDDVLPCVPVFGPISATAQLQLNPKPEHDGSGFTIPKIQLDMNMDILAIGKFVRNIHIKLELKTPSLQELQKCNIVTS